MGINTQSRCRFKGRYILSLFLAFGVALGAFAQSTVKGKVKDDQGQGLPGVSVVVKGTTAGSVSDIEGNYTVSTTSGNAVLVFSFIGYLTQEIPLNNKSVLDVTLATDVKSLNEVVVVGYGTAKKATLTGSVVAVKGSELEKAPAANFQYIGWTSSRCFGGSVKW